MSIKVVSDKLKELANELDRNQDSYDLAKLKGEIQEFEKKVFKCKKPDKGILAILGNKKNFKTRPKLDAFVESLIHTNSTIRSRTEAEIENTLLLMKHNISLEEIESKLPKEEEKPKKKTSKASKKEKLPLETWIKTEQTILREELKNYTVSELKKTGSMYLKPSDKSKRKKDEVIEAILRGIREIRAVSRLGS